MSESTTGNRDGGIVQTILGIFASLAAFWNAIPEESRDKIINNVVEAFDTVLRAFYRRFQDSQPNNEDEANA
ncbi:MAG: hypothetical protein EOP24_31885 [Hyphomicrobiales bacterium]|nr:MAG: hypothetical protein EOP24_31885 [Hyphomicrobiales bacterium]